MTLSLQSALPEGLTFLRQITEQNVDPQIARTRLGPLQDRFPDMQLDLVWETMRSIPGDEHTHYDLLLQQPGEATATLSYCPHREIPWALQGASRWADKDLVRVNTTTLSVDRALAALDFIWDDRQLMTHVVNHCIVTDLLKSRQITVSDSELAQAVEASRHENLLGDESSWQAWLEAKGLTDADWSSLMADRVRVAKLRDQVIPAERIEEYFSAHQQAWQQLTLLIVPFANLAQAELGKQLVLSQRVSLAELAERQIAARTESVSGVQASFVTCCRGDLPPALRDAMDDGWGDDLLGPIGEADQFLLIKRLAVRPAVLDSSLRKQIADLLFTEWLAEQRQAAHVEWFWGPA